MKVFHYKYILTIFIISILTTMSYYTTKTMFMNLGKGQLSDAVILSPQTVTYVDEEETKKQKELVLSQVQAIYEMDPKVEQEQVKKLRNFLSSVIEQKRLLEDAINESKTLVENVKIDKGAYIKAVYNPYQFSGGELSSFFDEEIIDLNRMKEVFSKELENFYLNGITEDKLEDQKKKFVNNAIFYHYDEVVRNLLLNKISSQLEANFILSKEETAAKQKEALKTVTPVTKTIQRGERIVGKNEVITNKEYEALKAAGLINDKFDVKEAMSKIPFTLLIFTCLHLFLFKFSNKEIKNQRLYLFVFVVALVSTFLVNLLQWEYFTYGMLVLSLVMITTFLSASVSIVYALALGMLIHPGDYSFLTMAAVLGVVQALGHNPKSDRSTILNFGLVMGTALVVSKLVLQFLLGLPIVISDLIPMFAGSVVASWIVLGLFGYLEKMLGVVTSLKLHELTSPDNKLYQRLNNEAPGTLQHSLRVGNLAEAAADAIGANGLLLKAGAIYHDAGKLENPSYFIENLIETNAPNPHDTLTPKESAAFIKQHPIDSVKLCRKYKLPEEILSLIEKHHGDDLVKYFYHKELENNPDANVEDFKYQTPLPVTKEEGILMLADITEASSRSIMYEEPIVFKRKLTDILYQKVEDGQLRECELTMKEISIVIDTFIKQLIPANHKRPKYPNQK
ncbi:HD family phosphohydrolase [Bacillus thuringiensis]|uniref:HD family phosphohydrolase n=1 Tax=Bacillus thuringiensis TaxID=1428 RepID=UPI0021D6711C|nr:HDIG domain-containing metalloprotein [Bacillus thuringiensis]MCU7666768.1 HDIG domain-containing protein [Bacillus thuringiensis]